MKKLMLLFFGLAMMAFAEMYDSTGKWGKLGWNGYEPYPEISTEDEVVHINGITSKYGFAMRSTVYYPAVSGDKIVFHGLMKGKGTISLGIQCFTEPNGKGTWTGIPPEGTKCELPEDWSEIELSVPVVDLQKGMTQSVMVTWHLNTGDEAFLKESSVTVEKGDISGNGTFPRQFSVFIIGRHGEEIQFPKDEIPAELYGVKPLDMTMNNGIIDFSKYFNKRVLRENALLYAAIDSASDMNYTIGAGADYFLAYYVNGEKVIDTMKTGDGADTPHFTNHKATVRLKKGKNILAIHFQTGTGVDPMISLAGPDELRNLTSILNITDVFEKDDYETAMERTGKPALRQDILTDGMENKTMQAIYAKGTVLASGKAYAMPPRAGEKYAAISLRICRFPEFGDIKFSLTDNLEMIARRREEYANDMEFVVLYGGNVQKSVRVPVKALPCDCLFAASASQFCVNVASLNDSKLRAFDGRIDLSEVPEFQGKISFDTANAAVDEYSLGIASKLVRSNSIPIRLDLEKTFDPVKAGWKLVWSDEFDEEEVDWVNTWMNTPWDPEGKVAVENRKYASIKDGMLHIKCVWDEQNPDGTYKGKTTGLYSRRHYGYGYYEARLRFTKKPGWWAAFWMHNEGRNNQLGGGYEIDIFEDYSTRGGEPVVASNLHVTRGPNQNSYGSHFRLPGSLDEFYVIGVKWTPFEVSTYLNGKLLESSSMHTPLTSLTYDAINHALCTSTQYICISGQAGSSGGRAKEPGEEEYIVDYVRAYEYPTDGAPVVKWSGEMPKSCVKKGEKMHFEASADHGEVAYLFDNGYLVDYKTSKPFAFDWAIDSAHYSGTRWDTAGRSGVKPILDGYPHIFRICVQDADGKIGMTDVFPAIMDIQPGEAEEVFELPGSIKAVQFNHGGHNVCSYKQQEARKYEFGQDVHNRKKLHLREAGEYVSYTVDVKTDGKYEISMSRYDYRREWFTRALVIADGRYVGTIIGQPNTDTAYGTVKLHAGKQNIVIISAGTFGLQPDVFTFKLK